jgi:hypothetical protein
VDVKRVWSAPLRRFGCAAAARNDAGLLETWKAWFRDVWERTEHGAVSGVIYEVIYLLPLSRCSLGHAVL